MDRFTAFLFIILGISLMFIDEYNFRGVILKVVDYPIIKLFGVIISISFLYIFFKLKKVEQKDFIKTPQYTKCPNCKEVFNYNELKDGKCKNCKDVETVDLEEYFKKYPDELIEEDDRKDKNWV